MPVNVYSTNSFDRVAKKLHAKDKKVLDLAVSAVAKNRLIGEGKKGDLAGVFVYKFKLNHQQTLLAYTMQPNKLKPVAVTLLYVGPHENFYATLKRSTAR